MFKNSALSSILIDAAAENQTRVSRVAPTRDHCKDALPTELPLKRQIHPSITKRSVKSLLKYKKVLMCYQYSKGRFVSRQLSSSLFVARLITRLLLTPEMRNGYRSRSHPAAPGSIPGIPKNFSWCCRAQSTELLLRAVDIRGLIMLIKPI